MSELKLRRLKEKISDPRQDGKPRCWRAYGEPQDVGVKPPLQEEGLFADSEWATTLNPGAGARILDTREYFT